MSGCLPADNVWLSCCPVFQFPRGLVVCLSRCLFVQRSGCLVVFLSCCPDMPFSGWPVVRLYRCLVVCFSSCPVVYCPVSYLSGCLVVWLVGCPYVRMSGYLVVRFSSWPVVWLSICPYFQLYSWPVLYLVQLSNFPLVWLFGCLVVRLAGHPIVWMSGVLISECPDVPLSGCLVVWLSEILRKDEDWHFQMMQHYFHLPQKYMNKTYQFNCFDLFVINDTQRATKAAWFSLKWDFRVTFQGQFAESKPLHIGCFSYVYPHLQSQREKYGNNWKQVCTQVNLFKGCPVQYTQTHLNPLPLVFWSKGLVGKRCIYVRSSS